MISLPTHLYLIMFINVKEQCCPLQINSRYFLKIMLLESGFHHSNITHFSNHFSIKALGFDFFGRDHLATKASLPSLALDWILIYLN